MFSFYSFSTRTIGALALSLSLTACNGAGIALDAGDDLRPPLDLAGEACALTVTAPPALAGSYALDAAHCQPPTHPASTLDKLRASAEFMGADGQPHSLTFDVHQVGAAGVVGALPDGAESIVFDVPRAWASGWWQAGADASAWGIEFRATPDNENEFGALLSGNY